LFDAHKGTFYTGKDGGWAGDYCGTAREIIDTLKREWIHVGKGDRLWTLSEQDRSIDVREDRIQWMGSDLTLDANISLCANHDVTYGIIKTIQEENMKRMMELQKCFTEAMSGKNKSDGQSLPILPNQIMENLATPMTMMPKMVDLMMMQSMNSTMMNPLFTQFSPSTNK